MSDVAADAVLRHAPGPIDGLPACLARARAALAAAMAELARIPDAEMEFAWDWEGQQTDVRYGFYRLYELLEGAAAHVERTVGAAAWGEARADRGGYGSPLDLHGLLATLGDDDLDADRGGEEWTIRQTLDHMIATRRDAAADTLGEYAVSIPEAARAHVVAHPFGT